MTYEKFSAENAALLLIDHQVGTRSWVKSIPFEEMKRNALMLAKAAKILKLPVVLTSSMEEYAQGPLLGELESILPGTFAKRIKRVGIVDAMDDEKLAAAVRATGRKKLIIAGVTNERVHGLSGAQFGARRFRGPCRRRCRRLTQQDGRRRGAAPH
jgi:nicotinamidase-related amidase